MKLTKTQFDLLSSKYHDMKAFFHDQGGVFNTDFYSKMIQVHWDLYGAPLVNESCRECREVALKKLYPLMEAYLNEQNA